MTEYLAQHIWLIGLAAFCLGLCTMPLVLYIARKHHLVVRPNKRTSHTGEIPNIGGLNIFFTLVLAYSAFCLNRTPESQFLLLGIIAIFIVGFVDDIIILSPLNKLFFELVAGVALIGFADIRITDLHGLFSLEALPPYLSYAVSFFILAAIINAFNLIDGIDGLASGLGIMYCLFFAVWFSMAGDMQTALIAACLIGALSVFFCYNVFGGSHTKIFMGDSGSLLVGYMLTTFVFRFCESNATHMLPEAVQMSAAPAVAVCIMGVPLFDTLRVSITRIMHGHSPFRPDKNHIHHLLLQTGLNHIQTTCVLLSVTALLTLIAIVGRNSDMYLLTCAAFAVYLMFMLTLKYILKHKKPQTEDCK